MLQPLWRTGGACTALGLLLCAPAIAHALHDVSTAETDDNNQDSWGPLQQMRSHVALLEAERGTLVEDTGGDGGADDEMMDGDSTRKLLHGCHGSPRCRKSITGCPRCRFPSPNAMLGHCRRGGKLQNCRRSRETRVDSASVPTRFVAADGFGAIGPGECPSIHAQAMPGHFGVSPDFDDYADGDYEEERVPLDEVFDAFGYEEGFLQIIPREFAAVSNGRELQRALRDGVNHIVLTQHLDLVDAQTVPDLPDEKLSLDTAVGRVLNTTLSIVGMCDGPPPADFILTEPLAPGACVVRVREDFIDAPLGTTCLLIDSLYMVVAPRGGATSSSTLILHIDGLMWIANCVFQGAGVNTRAIDTSNGGPTGNGRTPALYIQNTTFTGFTRSLGPGIRALPGSRLWLDSCVFRDITVTRPMRAFEIQASSIAADDDVELILVNTTFEGNVVNGEPAGDREVSISLVETEIYASPRMRVWVWPEGPFVMTEPDVGVAETVTINFARPLLRAIQDISEEITRRGLKRFERMAMEDG